MPRIVLSSSMLRDYARLPQDVAGKVSNLITNFAQQAFAGAHIETPKAARDCLLYTSPSPRDRTRSRMPSSA